MRRAARRLAVAAVLGVVGWAVVRSAFTPGAGPGAADYDTSARPPGAIAPGTVVGRSAPEGWSHLVLKSRPRVRPGEVANVPNNLAVGRAGSVRLAGWMVPVFVADVTPDAGRFRLRAVAIGLAAAVDGRDVVVTPESAAAHGVALDWVTRSILTKGHDVQRSAVVAVHAPAFGLVDRPAWFRCGGRNRPVRFRYALLVDAAAGRLDALVWLLDPANECGDAGAAELLPADGVDDAELVPDPAEFNALGVPSEAAFAVDQLPAGRARVMLPPGLRGLAMQTRFTADEARGLEAGLRRLLPP